MTCLTTPVYGTRLPTGGGPSFITSSKPFIRSHQARMAARGEEDENHLGSVGGKSWPTKRTAEIKRVSQRRESDGLMGEHKLTDGITANIFVPLVLQICCVCCILDVFYTKLVLSSSRRSWCMCGDPPHRSSQTRDPAHVSHAAWLTFLMKYFQLVISHIVIRFC